MSKTTHEFRDPVHVFIRLDSDERKVVDSEPFQRLRHIHQLAMTYLVYPGATHRRFEHSLGCMELATRIFDTITRPENIQQLPDAIRDRLPEIEKPDQLAYWRKILRMAALCHDIGHLPFSHAAEGLFPPGMNHEVMTNLLIMDGMSTIWGEMQHPRPERELIAKIAVGEKHAMSATPFTPWERILTEIITGDAFGADRMDYLLRDSLHAGVTYGNFDYNRLIDTMRILPGPAKDKSQKYDAEPELGIEIGGIQVAESLLVARYLMFSQVYFHHVRRIYDLHFIHFLKEKLENGVYPTNIVDFVSLNDNEMLSMIYKAQSDQEAPGHIHAHRIAKRKHFKKVFQATTQYCEYNPSILQDIYEALCNEFGCNNIIKDDTQKPMSIKYDFPIKLDSGAIISAHAESKVMKSLPMATAWYIFANPTKKIDVAIWLHENESKFLTPKVVKLKKKPKRTFRLKQKPSTISGKL